MISYRASVFPNNIVIFGCGGTGSRLVPLIAQFIKTVNYVTSPHLWVCDFDKIESKNLTRQNFVASDVGKNKAEVLASRYGKAFNVKITPVARDITEDRGSLGAGALTFESPAIYILCVDSIKARQDLVKWICYKDRSGHGSLIVDTGNEDSYGQIKLMTPVGLKPHLVTDNIFRTLEKHNELPYDVILPSIPFDASYFSSMKEGPVKLSCADLDQTMAINCLVANHTFAVLQDLYFARPISFHRLNISISHGATPEYMTPGYFKKLLKCPLDRAGYTTYQSSTYRAQLLEGLQKIKGFLPPEDDPDSDVAVGRLTPNGNIGQANIVPRIEVNHAQPGQLMINIPARLRDYPQDVYRVIGSFIGQPDTPETLAEIQKRIDDIVLASEVRDAVAQAASVIQDTLTPETTDLGAIVTDVLQGPAPRFDFSPTREDNFEGFRVQTGNAPDFHIRTLNDTQGLHLPEGIVYENILVASIPLAATATTL